MSNKKTLIASETPKGREILRNCAVGLDKAGLPDEDALQNVVHRAGELQAGIAELVKKLSVPISNRFADEEVPSKYGYLSGYKPKGEDLKRQTKVIKKLFPSLGGCNQEYLVKIQLREIRQPKFGEKFFAIPNWVKHPEIFGAAYGEAVEKVLSEIKKARGGKFINYREGQLGPDRLRQSERSIEAWKSLSEEQGNPDILIISAQFGIRYPQKDGTHIVSSVRRARIKFVANEFGLGAFAVGIMILTHPERLRHLDDLWIDCAGDEYRSVVASDFCFAPYFSFDDGRVEFGTFRVGNARGYFGSASGFSRSF